MMYFADCQGYRDENHRGSAAATDKGLGAGLRLHDVSQDSCLGLLNWARTHESRGILTWNMQRFQSSYISCQDLILESAEANKASLLES